MALNLGLILGSALAGAAAGGGDAAEKMGASMQDAQQKQDLVKLQSDLDEQKQLRIQEAEHTFQNQFQQSGFTQQDKTQANQQTFQAGQTDKELSSREKVSAANNATSLAVANIGAGSAMSVERMRVDAQKEIQKLANKGIQLVQDGTGAYVSVDKTTGATTPIMVGDKPLIGAKNVDTATAMAAAALLKPDPTDDDATQKRNRQTAYKMLGIDPNKGSYPQPSAAAIAQVKANPAMAPQFEAKFGPGSAASITGKSAGQTDANPFNGAPPLPGGGDPGAGTNNPALINGQIPQQAAAPAQPTVGGSNTPVGANARNPAPTPPVAAAPVNPAPAPYQPSALIANAMTPQTGAPPTQPAFRQQLDAFGRPIPLNTVQNQLGL